MASTVKCTSYQKGSDWAAWRHCIDFIIKDLDAKSRSVVASRKDAMLRKRQTFYFGEAGEKPLLYPGRIVEARVIAVAPKAVRLEVFGVEVSVRARDMAWEWMGDAGEKFQVGDLVLVMVNNVEADSVDQIRVEVDAKSPTANTNKDNLRKCHRQGNVLSYIPSESQAQFFTLWLWNSALLEDLLCKQDTFWKSLREDLMLTEDFQKENQERIQEFLFEGGAEIMAAYLKSRPCKQEEIRRLVVAELLGKFQELKYPAGDLEREQDLY